MDFKSLVRLKQGLKEETDALYKISVGDFSDLEICSIQLRHKSNKTYPEYRSVNVKSLEIKSLPKEMRKIVQDRLKLDILESKKAIETQFKNYHKEIKDLQETFKQIESLE